MCQSSEPTPHRHRLLAWAENPLGSSPSCRQLAWGLSQCKVILGKEHHKCSFEVIMEYASCQRFRKKSANKAKQQDWTAMSVAASQWTLVKGTCWKSAAGNPTQDPREQHAWSAIWRPAPSSTPLEHQASRRNRMPSKANAQCSSKPGGIAAQTPPRFWQTPSPFRGCQRATPRFRDTWTQSQIACSMCLCGRCSCSERARHV